MAHTALEAAFLQLLVECAPLVRPTKQPLAKWVHIKKNEQQLKSVRNDTGEIQLGMAIGESRYAELASYRECKRLYESDTVFKDAPRLAGYWGQFMSVLPTVASRTGSVRRGRLRIDEQRVVAEVRALREHFASSSFRYECRARIHGVGLSSRFFFLPDGIQLRRLSLSELDQRQLPIQPYLRHARGGPEACAPSRGSSVSHGSAHRPSER